MNGYRTEGAAPQRLRRLVDTRPVICAAIAAALLIGCGDDPSGPFSDDPNTNSAGVGWKGTVVGGACAVHADCAGGSICLRGGDFPGGTCSVSCRDDGDCPTGSACVDKDGGVCLMTCTVSRDCRAGYQCDGKDRRTKGKVFVCIED